VIVVLLGAVFIFRHVARKRSVRAARNELTETIQPKLGQLEERERELEQFRSEVQQQHELAPAQWDELVDILPEYQKLRLALEHYSQALHEFHSAQSRIEQAWGRVRELAPDAPEDPDTSWMASRIEELVDFTDQKRLRDETQGAREAENRQIDELKQEADQVRNELHDHLDKYNLGEQLEEDLDAAVAEFQAMARKTREYRQLRAEAQSLDKLHLRQRELIDRLAEIMDAVGLAEEARQNHEQALEQYEQRKQEAQRYQNLLNQHQDLLNQAEATGLTRELFTERWGRESELEQQALEGMVADETEYGELLKRIESLAEEENLIKHSLNQNQQKAIRLREMLAREKHIPGAYDEAFRKEEEARKQMNTVRVWQRALLILEEKFRQVQRDLSGRMAPAIVEGVDKVLARTPLGNIAGVEVGGNMELKVQLKDAPEKLSAGDRIQLLSSGARRQLALVVRLGVADALGAERSAPLMLDEPLDELDDTRAKDCLKFLGALATDTQVLLTTCHRHNHEWMLESTGVAAHELALTQQGSKTATATTVEPPAMDSGE
jgi:DNA repair exonuclease SbcCD ATPase subunit